MIADLTDSFQWMLTTIGGEWFAAVSILAMLVIGGIGGFIGWIAGLQKNVAEIASLQSQIVANEGQTLLNTQQSRRRYNELAARCGNLGASMIVLVKRGASITELDDGREALAACLLADTIPAFLDGVEWARLHLKSTGVSPDRYTELLDDSIAELRRFKTWLDTINHPTLIGYLKRAPQVIQARTLRQLNLVVEQFPEFIRNEQMRRVSAVIKEIAPATASVG